MEHAIKSLYPTCEPHFLSHFSIEHVGPEILGAAVWNNTLNPLSDGGSWYSD